MATILFQWNGINTSQYLTSSAFGLGLSERPSGSVSASYMAGNSFSAGRPFVRFQCAGLRTNINTASGSAWIIPLNLGVSLPKRYTMKIYFVNSNLVSGTNTNFKPMILHCTSSLASASFSGRGIGNFLVAENTALLYSCFTGGISQSTVSTGFIAGGSSIIVAGTGTMLELSYNTGETPFARSHSPFYIKSKVTNFKSVTNALNSSAVYHNTGTYAHNLTGLAWDSLALGFQSRLALTPQFDNHSYIDIQDFVIFKHPLDE